MILGLTGGIASGKSTVSKFFTELGVEVVDADIIAREIAQDEEVLKKISLEFGEEAVINNSLNRKYISGIIFSDPQKRENLNKIMHPAIISKIKFEINSKRDEKLVIADIPLLYETGLETEMDKVAVVYIDKNTQINRLVSREKTSEEEAVKRIDSQMKLEEKAKNADILIENLGSLEELKDKIKRIYNELI